MANSNLKAEQEAIAQKVKEFQATHDELEHLLTQLRSDADTLTEPAIWQGAAANAFKSFMDSYADGAKKLNNQLMETADKLNTMGSQLQQHDEDHASQVAKQTSSLSLP
jgi:WXG100 family type VII secretion target